MIYIRILEIVFFEMEWYEVLDYIEFIAKNDQNKDSSSTFKKFCNQHFEQELSAYRFVGNEIVEINSKEEVAAIEEALRETDKIKPVKVHFETALKLLSDKKNPDFRNSIKESISAVEAICKLITGDKNATLGHALKTIHKQGQVELHGALKSSFEQLYGYTSDGDGIRHSLLDESNLTFDDAKFMLVSCSAFVNFLISKSAKAGIALTD